MIKMTNPVVTELKAENLTCQKNLPAYPALQLQPQLSSCPKVFFSCKK